MKHFKYFIAFAIAVVMTACSSKDDYSSSEETTKYPIRITADINGVDTRSTGNPSTVHNTQFFDGDQINVLINRVHAADIFGKPNEDDGYVIFTNSSTQGWTSEYDLYAVGTNDDLCAFGVYPAKDGEGNKITESTTSFEVQDSQNTDDNYNKSDLMYAYTTDADPKSPIPLTFNHCMSKITIKIADCSEICTQEEFLSGNKQNFAYVENITRQATLSTETGYNSQKLIATGTGTQDDDILVCTKNEDDALFTTGVSCIIPPQKVNEGTSIITITYDTDYFMYYTAPADGIDFKAGYEYVFNLTLRRHDITLSNVQIKPWEGGTGSPFDGDAE